MGGRKREVEERVKVGVERDRGKQEEQKCGV